MGVAEELEHWRKAIPKARDRAQSRILVWTVGTLLITGAIIPPLATLKLGLPLWSLTMPLAFSAGFAILVYALRAATPAASILGFLICFILAQSPEAWTRYSPYPASHSALAALVAVFALTFLATKLGRSRKEARGLAEPRRGRQASQIVANLGVAGLFAAAGCYPGCIAALAEAAADTVSSEVGQAFGGPARLLTNWNKVTPGTDGGITIVGTAAGLGAAAVVVTLGALHHALWPKTATVLLCACGGLFFDSLLGATLERRGWIGNDLVNLSSTLFAALLAMALS
jgi:uncharacterized protein (TIGR00297 family)